MTLDSGEAPRSISDVVIVTIHGATWITDSGCLDRLAGLTTILLQGIEGAQSKNESAGIAGQLVGSKDDVFTLIQANLNLLCKGLNLLSYLLDFVTNVICFRHSSIS